MRPISWMAFLFVAFLLVTPVHASFQGQNNRPITFSTGYANEETSMKFRSSRTEVETSSIASFVELFYSPASLAEKKYYFEHELMGKSVRVNGVSAAVSIFPYFNVIVAPAERGAGENMPPFVAAFRLQPRAYAAIINMSPGESISLHGKVVGFGEEDQHLVLYLDDGAL